MKDQIIKISIPSIYIIREPPKTKTKKKVRK